MTKPDDQERVSLDPLNPVVALKALLSMKAEPKPRQRKRRKAKAPTEPLLGRNC